MIARNDGTKLSNLTNDSPANGGNIRGVGIRIARAEGEREWLVPFATSSGQIGNRSRSAWKTTLEIRGFLINRQPLPFSGLGRSRIITSLNLNVALGPRPAASPGPRNLPSPSFPRRRADIFAFVNRERLTITEIPRRIFEDANCLVRRATGKRTFHRALIACKKMIGFRNFCHLFAYCARPVDTEGRRTL